MYFPPCREILMHHHILFFYKANFVCCWFRDCHFFVATTFLWVPSNIFYHFFLLPLHSSCLLYTSDILIGCCWEKGCHKQMAGPAWDEQQQKINERSAISVLTGNKWTLRNVEREITAAWNGQREGTFERRQSCTNSGIELLIATLSFPGQRESSD